MKMMSKGLMTGGVLAIIAGGAFADTLNYASGWPPGNGPTRALENYAASLAENSGDEVDMKVFSLTLLSFAEANSGVKDGIADLASILTPYFSAEFPTLNMISEFSTMVEQDAYASDVSSFAFAGAVAEYVMLNCPGCQTEVGAQNQVYMGTGMTPSYALQCTKPVTSVQELKGKRIRAGGAYWARWAEAMGAVPVSISINETFEALSQGVLDCTASTAAELNNFSFKEAVKHVYSGTPGGQFTVPTMINRERWQGLSAENRTALMKSNATLAAEMTWVYYSESTQAADDAAALGVEITTASDDLIAANQAFIANDLKGVVALYADKFGVEGGDDASAKMEELVARWTELTQDIDSVEALTDVYWNELYSKIDVSTYGM